jgi:hypothetical protein
LRENQRKGGKGEKEKNEGREGERESLLDLFEVRQWRVLHLRYDLKKARIEGS